MKKSIEELQDFRGSLKQLKYIVDNLVREFGENKLIEFDAGYNNVDVKIFEDEVYSK